ncbi:MAG: lasso peptide biosynthesis B2 protein [Acidimicrobiia bacterium]
MRFRSAALHFRLLGWRTRASLLPLCASALLVEIGLRTMNTARVARLCGVPLTLTSAGPPPSDPVRSALPTWARRELDLVESLMRHWPLDNTCLRRCLVAGRRLRPLGPSLRLGVARDSGVLRAHAWLEIDGRPLDPASAIYNPLASDLQ